MHHSYSRSALSPSKYIQLNQQLAINYKSHFYVYFSLEYLRKGEKNAIVFDLVLPTPVTQMMALQTLLSGVELS